MFALPPPPALYPVLISPLPPHVYSLQQDWDIDNYGSPTRSPPVYNAQGFFDSVNFSSAATYTAYRERIQVALTPYLLNGVDDSGAGRHTGVAVSAR
jgi:hypothetical protein